MHLDFGINKPTKPNFLIVGAAKAGTTALANYLSQHPDVYIPEIKEPRYLIRKEIYEISDDDPMKEQIIKSSILNQEEYFKLYTVDEKFKGDASVHYLYHSKQVIPRIKKLLGTDVVIVILLRNPITRLKSNYAFLKNGKFKTIEEELLAESQKINTGFNSFWYIKQLGLYTDHVKNYQDNFPNVHTFIFEEFILNPEIVCSQIFSSIGAKQYTNLHFRQVNKSTEVNKFYQIIKYLRIIALLKPIISAHGQSFVKKLTKPFFTKKPDLSISNQTKEELINFYKDDVNQLSELLKVDLKKYWTDFK